MINNNNPPLEPATVDKSQERKLYVGNLDARVDEPILTSLFQAAGEVLSVKIISDKNQQNTGVNYGFVEFRDHRAAEQAISSLNGTHVMNYDIRVNWAFQGTQGPSGTGEPTTNHFHVFVGDLSAEVNDQFLWKAFSKFASLSEARVMWDVNSGKSRGYGFVAFKDRAEAEQAIQTMSGEWIGSRPVRLNWANQKSNLNNLAMSGFPTSHIAVGANHIINQGVGPLSYEVVISQTSSFNTTVYIGNLPPNTTQNDIVSLFQQYGAIYEVKLQNDRGYAFVKFDTHENAAMAIVSANGQSVSGRPMKCSWGKDKGPENFYNQQVAGGYPAGAYTGYGMPMPPYGFYGQGQGAAGENPEKPGDDASKPNTAAGGNYYQQGLYNPSAYGYAGGWNQNQQYYNQQQQQ